MTGAIRGLFRAAVNALLRRTDEGEPRPQARRRRGETDKGTAAPFQALLRRVTKTGAATARGRYAALQPVLQEAQEPVAPADAYVAATAYTATTLEWLMSLWDANSSMEDIGGLDDTFDTKQDHCYPQP